ncbi:MAG: hypothetical protein OWT27_04650 [Firmicutes bacterium]|nr:hypothetical protein [Bacillota bacterium]
MRKSVAYGLAVSVLATVGFGAMSAPSFAAVAHHDMNKHAAAMKSMMMMGKQMAETKLLSPQQGDMIPKDHYVVEVQFTVPRAYAKDIPVMPAFVTPSSPYFKAGPNHFLPGLVVTDTGTAKKLGGAMRNLAGLFQIVGMQWNLSGSEVITADWFVAKPLFSAIPMACIRAYLVKGMAPAMVPMNPTNMDIGTAMHGMTLISNVAKTDFYTGSMKSMGHLGSMSGGLGY